MTRTRLVLGSLMLALLALAPARAQEASPASEPTHPHIAAVGDMVCHRGAKEGPNRNIDKWGTCDSMAVSQLVLDGNYRAFLALGDLQYLRGDIERYRKFYDETFGRVKDITMPVAGNHEYYTYANGRWADGYYTYFGAQAHPPHGYYSTNIDGWHVIVLNSQLCKEKSWLPRVGYVHGLPGDGCRPGDPQYEWLARDLRDHPNSEYACTLAAFHHPLFKWTEWAKRETDVIQRPLWRLLDRRGVDLVLNGHQHNYQRFEPMHANGQPSEDGISEFIVGTGGDTYGPFPEGDSWDGEPKPGGLVALEGQTYGVLDLTLGTDSYDWEFVTADGHPEFEDSGSADCR